MKTDLLVTIPAFHDELETLRLVVNDIHRVLYNYDHKVIVVFDKAAELEKIKLNAELYRQSGKGLADAFRKEMEIALSFQPLMIVHIDADRQYLPIELPRLIDLYYKGSDLVLGSRLKGIIEDMPLSKKIPNKFATMTLKAWLRQDITDITTGMRVFSPEIAKLPTKGEYTYTVEQIIRTARAGYKIASVPITFKARADGKSRLMRSPMHYIWETIKNTRRMLS